MIRNNINKMQVICILWFSLVTLLTFFYIGGENEVWADEKTTEEELGEIIIDIGKLEKKRNFILNFDIKKRKLKRIEKEIEVLENKMEDNESLFGDTEYSEQEYKEDAEYVEEEEFNYKDDYEESDYKDEAPPEEDEDKGRKKFELPGMPDLSSIFSGKFQVQGGFGGGGAIFGGGFLTSISGFNFLVDANYGIGIKYKLINVGIAGILPFGKNYLGLEVDMVNFSMAENIKYIEIFGVSGQVSKGRQTGIGLYYSRNFGQFNFIGYKINQVNIEAGYNTIMGATVKLVFVK